MDIGINPWGWGVYPPTFDKGVVPCYWPGKKKGKWTRTLKNILIKNVYQITPFEGCILKITSADSPYPPFENTIKVTGKKYKTFLKGKEKENEQVHILIKNVHKSLHLEGIFQIFFTSEGAHKTPPFESCIQVTG